MRRVIGIDIHRTLGGVVIWDDSALRSQWFALFARGSAWGCNLPQRHVRSASVHTEGFFMMKLICGNSAAQ